MSMIDGLECRRMFADTPLLRVKNIVADNRGEVIINLSERATGVKGAAAQLYTAGPDGTLFTNDDKKESVRFTYSENKKQIKLTAKLKKDTPYRVKLDGKTRIKSEASGQLLDGNFNAGGASGDGVAGGNYEAQFSRDKSSTPTVVIRTSVGDMLMRMRGDIAPKTVANYLSYANSGRYDNTFFARNDRNFVIQGGSLQIRGDGQDAADIVPTPADPELADEAPGAITNARGTLAFARGQGDDATSSFFVNLGNNAGLDSGFTVFAELVSGTESVADAISAKPIAAFQRGFAGNPQGILESVQGTFLAHVPVDADSQLTGSVQQVAGLGGTENQYLVTGGLKPLEDLQIIYRTAAFMKVASK